MGLGDSSKGSQGRGARRRSAHPGACALLLILLGTGLAILPSCGRDEGRPALRGKGTLRFVPLSDFQSDLLRELAGHYEKKYGVTVETIPSIPLDTSVVDAGRRQVIAEEVIGLMKRSRPDLADDPEAILIGFMGYDMYIRGVPNWRWAFSWRDGGRFAVISTARMDPKVFPHYSGPRLLQVLQAIVEQQYGIPLRERPDSVVLQRRLRKMVSKTIGIMYFGLPQSQDRRSVMYGPILGLDDLDSMGEEF